MARIKPLDDSDDPTLAAIAAQRGYVPNLYATLARSPELLRQFVALIDATRTELALDPKLREFAILAIAAETGATIQWLSHLPLARAAGATPEQLASLPAWRQSPLFSAVESAVLHFASEVATSGSPSDATWESAANHLDERRLVELSFITAFYTAVSRFLTTIHVDADPEYLAPALSAVSSGG